MPIWGAFFLLRLHDARFAWMDFARHGEFGLYAAAFLAPSAYLILKNMRKAKFPLQGGFVLVAILGILMGAFLYAGTNPQFGASAAVQFGTVDEAYLMRVSAILLSCAFVFSFFVTLIDIYVNGPDLGRADKVNQLFLNAELAVERPEQVTTVTTAELADEEPPIPSNDELKEQFRADRAEEDANG